MERDAADRTTKLPVDREVDEARTEEWSDETDGASSFVLWVASSLALLGSTSVIRIPR